MAKSDPEREFFDFLGIPAIQIFSDLDAAATGRSLLHRPGSVIRNKPLIGFVHWSVPNKSHLELHGLSIVKGVTSVTCRRNRYVFGSIPQYRLALSRTEAKFSGVRPLAE